MTTRLRGWTLLGAAVVVLALGVQLVADGLFGELARAPSLPHALAGAWSFGLVERLGLDRIAGVRIALARAALARGDATRAKALLAPLAADATTDDLRGRAALLLGDTSTALPELVAAGDFAAASPAIDALAARDPVTALAFVRRLDARLAAEQGAPETTALIEWREGQLAAAAAARDPAHARRLDRLSLDAYRRALERAPDEETYLLGYAFQALHDGQVTAALAAYGRAAQVVPDSVDAFVGVAAAAASAGDCVRARVALSAARAFATAQHRSADAASAGYGDAVLRALRSCAA